MSRIAGRPLPVTAREPTGRPVAATIPRRTALEPTALGRTALEPTALSRTALEPAALEPAVLGRTALGHTSTLDLVGGRFVPVADTPHGDEPSRRRRISLDLLPQPADVHGDGRLVAEPPVPHPVQQLAAGEGAGRVAQQELE